MMRAQGLCSSAGVSSGGILIAVLERFDAHLKRSALIPPGTRVLVGYSGGADSTCLLHLLHRAGVEVVAAHLHGQRSEADKEMKLCEAFCEQEGIVFLGGRADVPLLAKEMKIGLEEAGRHARYNFFSRAAAGMNCSLIATAHTRTDLVETVLLNIARGSGLSGLSGIPVKRDNIIRPLLAFAREDTRAYCDENGFWTHDDPANSDLAFARARVRHRIVGEFRAINPRFDEAVSRLAEIAAEEDSFLNGAAAAALEQAEIPLNGDLAFLTKDVEVAFRKSVLLGLPEVLLKRALRLAVGAVGASLDFDQTDRIVGDIVDRDKGAVTCEGGQVVLEWSEDTIHVREIGATTPYRYPLTVPGETISDEFGWQFIAFESESPTKTPARASMEAFLDPSGLKGTLYFRTFKEGDTIQPLGFSGTRKVSDLLGESKLTLAARSRLPIVCDLVGCLWIPGVCLSERARIREGQSKVLSLRFSQFEAESSHNEGNVSP